MKLNYQTRDSKKKSESKRIRREGSIPSIIYSRGKNSESVSVCGSMLAGLLRTVQPGRLSTTVFTLLDDSGKERKAILKDIQYEPTTYGILHLDFEELIDDLKVNVKIPIECVGVADCPGVKLGGVLRQVVRSLRVRCLPKDIPAAFFLDVKMLGARESRRLKDLEIPNTLRPLSDLNEVVAVIVKR